MLLSPLGKGWGPSFEQLECPSSKFGWNWPSCSGEEDKENVKSLQQRWLWRQRWTMDKLGSEKLILVFGSGELINQCQTNYVS